MTVQMDLFNPATRLTTINVEGVGDMIESVGGSWRAARSRWGWNLYRLTTSGWESWEPPLPYGQAYLDGRYDAEQVLESEIDRHGDAVLVL